MSGATVTEPARREIDVLGLAIRYKWMLLAGLTGGLLLGEVAYLQLGALYEAKALVLVSRKASAPIDNVGGDTYGERAEHIALIMSPLIVGRAIEKHGLEKLPTLDGEENPAQEIVSNLLVKRSAGEDRSFLNVLDLTYRSKSEEDAKTILAAIIDAYGEYLENSRQENTDTVVGLVNQAQKELGDDLRKKEEAYLKFRNESPLHWTSVPGAERSGGDAANVHMERVLAIEAERRRLLLQRAETESRIGALEKAIAGGASQQQLEEMVRLFLSSTASSGAAAVPGSTMPTTEQATLDAQLLPLLLREKELLRDYGEDHPDVQMVRKSIQTTIDFYRAKGVRLPEQTVAEGQSEVDFIQLFLGSMRQSLDEMLHRDQALAALAEEESTKAKALAHYQLQDQALSEDIQRSKRLWDTIVEQLGRTQLTRDSNGYQSETIAPVRVELVVKRHLKFLGGGAAVSVAGVLGAIYLLTLRDTGVRTVEDLRQNLRQPILGAIPTFAEATTPGESAEIPAALRYLRWPASIEAESFRAVRTALFVGASAESARVIQVTSPLPGDGKTTLTANLAIAIAQSGKKVLLVDADLRNPSLRAMLELAHDVGLSDVLASEIEPSNAIQESRVPGLYVLTAGTMNENPAELLASDRMPRLLKELRREFDFVLIDTPPLLAVSDPCVIGPWTDATVMVVRLGVADATAIARATELVEAHKLKSLGVIANGVAQDAGSRYGIPDGYRSTADRPRRSTPAREEAAT